MTDISEWKIKILPKSNWNEIWYIQSWTRR